MRPHLELGEGSAWGHGFTRLFTLGIGRVGSVGRCGARWALWALWERLERLKSYGSASVGHVGIAPIHLGKVAIAIPRKTTPGLVKSRLRRLHAQAVG